MKNKLIFSLLMFFSIGVLSSCGGGDQEKSQDKGQKKDQEQVKEQSQNQALRFNVINSTGYDLYGVYVSAGEQEDWGEDVISEDIFENGTNLTIDIAADYGESCSFDMRITLDPDEKDDITFSDLDLCKITTLTLNSDGTTDVVWEE